MYSYAREDLLGAFKAAPNMNAALKGFLKNEVTRGDQAAKFVKSFRAALSSKSPDAFDLFVDKALPRYERHFLLVARYAYSETIEPILDQTIQTHAESFNETFTIHNNVISITDKKNFDTIARLALQELDASLEQSPLPRSNFMRNVLIVSLFEPEVIENISADNFH